MICTITELPLWRVTNHDRSKENLSRVPNQSQIQIERNSYKTSGFRPNQTIFAKIGGAVEGTLTREAGGGAQDR